MTSRLQRPAGALLATVLAAGILGVTPSAYAADGTITGTVTGSGGPLDSVYVSAYHQVEGAWVLYQGDNGSALTDTDGTYALSLPAGPYRLEFADNTDGSHLDEFYEDAATVQEADSIPVGASPVTVDADLAEASHITGTVTVPDQLPVTDVWVQVYEEVAYEGGGTGWVWLTGASVEADGTYDVSGLPAGTYRVGFVDDLERYAAEFYDDQPTVRLATDVTVGDADTEPAIDAALALDSTVSGTVTGAAGSPVEGAMVQAFVAAGEDWDEVGFAWTDIDGKYTVGGLKAGTYRVEFGAEMGEDYAYEVWNNAGSLDEGDDIEVDPNETVTDKNAQLVVGEHDAPEVKYVEGVTIPTISGTPQVGSTLTATPGTWTPADITATYQWYRGWDAVPGATGSSYTLTSADEGQYLWVEVLASYPGYEDRYNMSDAFGPIAAAPTTPVVAPAPAPVVAPAPAPAPVPAPVPVIVFSEKIDVVGKLAVGSTLKLKNYKALVTQVAATATYKVQWYAGSKKIKKATKSKLKVTQAMKGKKVLVKVTATVGSTSKAVKVKVGTIR